MTNKFFLFSLGGVGLVALAALGLIMTMVNPFRATTMQLAFFYSALFFVAATVFAIAAFIIIRYLGVTKKEGLQVASLREGSIVGALVVMLLLLQSQQLLSLPVIIVLVVIVGFIELYASSSLLVNK